MERLIDEIDIDCPYCNKEFSISVDSVGETVTCPHCCESFETVDNGFTENLKSAEEQYQKLLDTLDSF